MADEARPTAHAEASGLGAWQRFRTGILTLVLLIAVAIWLAPTEFDPEAPGLGNNTASVRDASVAGVAVRDNGRPVLEVFDSLPTREGGVLPIVWLGNSHQHAVNSLKPGDTVASVYLHLALNGEMYPGRAPVIGISYPNLRFEEQFLLTLALALREPERRPAVIVQGVRFHDAREMGVRSMLRPLLEQESVKAWLANQDPPPPEYGEAIARLRADADLADSERKKEEGLEAWLVAHLGPHLPIFRQREWLYASIEDRIHNLRDRVFRIDTRTKRPILKSRYLLSMQFIELALRVAREHGIETLLYNVPLRQEMDNPYLPDDYAAFRRDLAALAARHGATFRDYDDLIPRDLWGRWYDTDMPDFSHFTAAGHRLLATQVATDIAPLLGIDAAERNSALKTSSPEDAVQ
ncbi:MAG TPA: SGNH/GDSL hydrolase family protein [Myxococcota bacterium]|nr:SGNH/GDSL hydrolase family protein [Myxococcota bacterium]